MSEPASQASRRMKLRYAGTCRHCGAKLAAGDVAIYDREARRVACLGCEAEPSAAPQPAPVADWPYRPRDTEAERAAAVVDEPEVVGGVGGASAQREYDRRSARREERVRARYPRLGGVILALVPEPQSTRAWTVGARGEEKLAVALDALTGNGVCLLHDRRIHGTRSNIDHIAISAGGVFVIDAKRYSGRPVLQVQGGLFRPRVETLRVGGRDRTKLVAGVHKQVHLVRESLAGDPAFAGVPVAGMLCFVDGDWPMFGGSFTVEGLHVLWPRKAQKILTKPGPLGGDQVRALHRRLADWFPAA